MLIPLHSLVVGEAERRDKRVIVTACMDRMTFARQIDVRADLELDGHVCWTGRSSLSVAVSLAEISEVGERSPIAQASFLMVSRATDRDEAIVCHSHVDVFCVLVTDACRMCHRCSPSPRKRRRRSMRPA